MRRFAHVIGFDDAPFDRAHRGDVPLIGAVYAGQRLEGVLAGKVRRDGANATRVLASLVRRSRFRAHVKLVLLQGIALAGFNVVDLAGLHRALGIPVLVVVRRPPNLARVRRALLEHVPGGERKWRLIERAGPVEPLRTGVRPARRPLARRGGARARGARYELVRARAAAHGPLDRGWSGARREPASRLESRPVA
ncbi:MAG: DUF99 family protein [Burkholderiales bacterium]|nr:DUF99 family protein [Burkholderiales bacterium]